jgi:hypothetical protein
MVALGLSIGSFYFSYDGILCWMITLILMTAAKLPAAIFSLHVVSFPFRYVSLAESAVSRRCNDEKIPLLPFDSETNFFHFPPSKRSYQRRKFYTFSLALGAFTFCCRLFFALPRSFSAKGSRAQKRQKSAGAELSI